MILNTVGVFAVGAKEHDSEHRRGFCCRVKKMGLLQMERLRGRD